MVYKEQFAVIQPSPKTCVGISLWPPVTERRGPHSCGGPIGTMGQAALHLLKKGMLTHRLEPLQLSDQQLAGKRQEGNYMAHCGSVWENMTYTEKYVASLFSKNISSCI